MAALIFIPFALCLLFFFTGIFIDNKEITVHGYAIILFLLGLVFFLVMKGIWIPLFEQLYVQRSL